MRWEGCMRWEGLYEVGWGCMRWEGLYEVGGVV